MIIPAENPIESVRKLLELIHESSKVRRKIYIQYQQSFYIPAIKNQKLKFFKKHLPWHKKNPEMFRGKSDK